MTSDFEKEYKELERCFEHRVELDRLRYPNSVFLPNVPPNGPVDFVFIGMEPSYDKWAKDRLDAEQQIASGYRNFMYSLEDFILHYCIRRYLCNDGSTYYITDLSKGAMNTKIADTEREERYQNWYPLLQKELSLVAKYNTKLIAIGKSVEQFLSDNHHQPAPIYLHHYSNQNGKSRKDYITDNHKELEFENFKYNEPVTRQDIITEAKTMLMEWNIPQLLIEKTVTRIGSGTLSLSEPRHILIFVCADIFIKVKGHLTVPH